VHEAQTYPTCCTTPKTTRVRPLNAKPLSIIFFAANAHNLPCITRSIRGQHTPLACITRHAVRPRNGFSRHAAHTALLQRQTRQRLTPNRVCLCGSKAHHATSARDCLTVVKRPPRQKPLHRAKLDGSIQPPFNSPARF